MAALTDAANKICALTTALLLAAILLINGMEILSRSVFSLSFAWTFETNLLFASWVYFIGIYQVYHRNADITVDFFTSRLPPRIRLVWATILDAATCVVLAILAWYGWQLIQLQLPFRTPGSGIPNALFTAPLVISAVLMIFAVSRRSVERLQSLSSGRSDAGTEGRA